MYPYSFASTPPEVEAHKRRRADEFRHVVDDTRHTRGWNRRTVALLPNAFDPPNTPTPPFPVLHPKEGPADFYRPILYLYQLQFGYCLLRII